MLEGIFAYSFITRAFVIGALVSLCAALLGVSLVLKRYSMIGDGLSHVSFGAMSVAAAMNLAPLALSVPVVLVAAFFLLRLSENSKIKGDAAIAVISSSALAVGIVVTSLTTGINTDVCNYMFGSILAMTQSDVYLSVVLSALVIIMFVLFYNKIFAVTFDESFSRATGVRAGVYNTCIAMLTAITIVLGMRIMGALLISSLVIFPALSAMRICKSFKAVVITSAVLSLICFFAGMTASYVLETPVGASVVIADLIVFGILSLVGKN